MTLWDTIIARRAPAPDLRRMRVAGDTHTGRVRKHNEDSYLYIVGPAHEAVLLGVADGMGGHEGGEVASYLAMYYLIREWNGLGRSPFSSQEDVRSFLYRALCGSNDHLHTVNRKLKIRRAMGTTSTVGILWDRYLVVAHVGDSRCYRVRKRKISQLTSDQNWMSEMIQSGRLSPMEAAMHPLAKTLSNCVGAVEGLHVDFSSSVVHEGDRYLFCTDGVSTLLDDYQLLEELWEAETPGAGVKRVLHLALRNGGLDNLSAVCLFV